MTKKGTLMGWNCEPTAANLALAQTLGTTWIRWGLEWQWILNDPADHTSGFDSAALAGLDADIARVHAKGMRCIVNFFGVPPSINASANTGDGGGHYWPTNGTGDTAMGAAAAEVISHLTAFDILQCGNELANIGDFNKGNQSAARVGATQVAMISAARAAAPGVPILAGSLNAIGDTGDPYSIPVWGDAMVAANPTLLTTAAPNWFSVHPYAWGGGSAGDNSPFSTKGWIGHVQADQFRQKLLARGWSDPGLVITEFGEPSTPGPDFTEAWQQSHATDDYIAIDFRRGVGWYVGPEIRHTLIDVSLAIDAGHEFGAWRANHTLKPVGWTVAARAGTDIEATAAAPVANFTWAAGATPKSATFTNLSTDATSFEWDFDDDAIIESTATNPTFTYPAAGDYDCTLTATGPGGTDSVTITVTVEDVIGVGDWDYDSAALPFDWPGLLDDPFDSGPTTPPVSGGMSVSVSLGIPPRLTDGYFNVDSSVVDGTVLLGPDEVWHLLPAVVTEASWAHGSTVERGRPDPGSMTLRASAKNRDLDPTNTDGPYGTDLAERPRLRLRIDGTDKFTGTVEDSAVRYYPDHVETEFQVVDGWGQLDNDLTWTPNVIEQAGARIARLLRLGGYTGQSFIMPGTVWMQAGTEQSGSVVDQIADVMAAEDGFAYFDGSGTFIFLDRLWISSLDPGVTFTDASGDGPRFSDADIGSDSRTFWPRVRVRGIEKNDPWQTAGNIDKGSRKGWRTKKLTLPLAFDADKLNLAQHLLYLFGKFRPRIRGAEFENAAAMRDVDRGNVLAAGLGISVNVRAVLTAGGSPETVESACIVAGEEGDVAPGYLRVAHRYLLGDSEQFFLVDDPTFGRVDGPYRIAS